MSVEAAVVISSKFMASPFGKFCFGKLNSIRHGLAALFAVGHDAKLLDPHIDHPRRAVAGVDVSDYRAFDLQSDFHVPLLRWASAWLCRRAISGDGVFSSVSRRPAAPHDGSIGFAAGAVSVPL